MKKQNNDKHSNSSNSTKASINDCSSETLNYLSNKFKEAYPDEESRKFILNEIDTFQTKSKIKIESVVNAGAFSQIFIGEQEIPPNGSKKKYVVKIIHYHYNFKDKKTNDESKKTKVKGIANNEIIYSYNLKHKFLIKMYGYYTMDNSFGLVLEYAGGKDLNHFQALFKKNLIFKRNNYLYVREGKGKMKEWKINYLSKYVLKFFFSQVVETLKYLRLMNVVHRDLKLENVFLMRNFQVKVGDLAFAKTIKSNEIVKATGSGTLAYMSPELFSNKLVNSEDIYKQDYFALGIMMFKLITFEFPLDKSITEDKSKISFEVVKESVEIENLNKILHRDRKVEKELEDLVIGLLNYNEKERFSLENILKNKWYKEEKDIKRIRGMYEWINQDIYEKNETDGMRIICELQKAYSYEINRTQIGIVGKKEITVIDEEVYLQDLYKFINFF